MFVLLRGVGLEVGPEPDHALAPLQLGRRAARNERDGPDAGRPGPAVGGDGGRRGLVRRARVSLPHHLVLRHRPRVRPAPPKSATAGLPEAICPSARLPASPDPQAAHAAAVDSLLSLDQEFLRRVNESILRHLADEAFGADQPRAAIGTGRGAVWLNVAMA